jgi:hypothetical protein
MQQRDEKMSVDKALDILSDESWLADAEETILRIERLRRESELADAYQAGRANALDGIARSNGQK